MDTRMMNEQKSQVHSVLIITVKGCLIVLLEKIMPSLSTQEKNRLMNEQNQLYCQPQAWDTGKQTDTVTNGSFHLCEKIYHKTVVKYNKYEHLAITV